MAYEKQKSKSRLIRFIAILAVVIPIILVVIAANLGRTGFNLPQKLTLELLGPVQSLLTSVVKTSQGIWRHYIDLVGLREENDKLLQELQVVKSKNLQYREDAVLNLSLSKNLALERSFELPTVTAQIIGRDPSLWFKTITIDKGSSSGIVKGMPVVSIAGVVGQVVNLSPDYAKVLLAIDPNSAIDAISLKHREQGIIKGKGLAYQFHYVLKNSEIEQGSQVLTSGMGGVFPKGVAVGTVTEVIDTPRGMFQKIMVTPAVDFQKLEYVTVILKVDSSMADF